MVPVLLIVVPLVAGLAAFAMKAGSTARAWALLSSLVTLALSVYALTLPAGSAALRFSAEWIQPLGIRFDAQLDGLGLILCLLTGIAFPLVLLGSWYSEYKNPSRYFGLLLLAQTGLMGVFVATDAMLFYFFWELALIPMYFLSSQWGGENRIRVTFKFFIYTFIGSLLMLIGILYLQSLTPDHSYSLASFYSLSVPLHTQTWLFWLFFIAFAIKMPIFPFHTWQPDTYEQAPGSTTMILSGVMVKMGLLGLIRWVFPIFPLAVDTWSIFIPPLALIGLIYASLIAMRQDDLKRLVAYSSIAHIGMMCAALFSEQAYGFQGVLIQMFNHGINIIGLWVIVEVIERRYGTRKMSELGGLARQAPVMAVFFVIIALANIALPLTNAFVGEFLMFNGIFQSNNQYHLWFTVMAGAGIILGAVYTLNMIRKVFYGDAGPAAPATGADLRLPEILALCVIVALIFIGGLYPQSLLHVAQPVSDDLVNKFEVIRFLQKP